MTLQDPKKGGLEERRAFRGLDLVGRKVVNFDEMRIQAKEGGRGKCCRDKKRKKEKKRKKRKKRKKD